MLPEALAGNLDQFWRHVEIGQRVSDIRMAHKGRKMRELRLRIDALSIPREHSVTHHRVAQIVDARTGSSPRVLDTRAA